MINKILLVIDVQEGFKNKNTQKVFDKIIKYIKANRKGYKYIVFTGYINNKKSPAYKIGYKQMFDIKETCIYKGLVDYIFDKKSQVFVKDTYSCMKAKKVVSGEIFEDWLKNNNIKEIDICGVETMCCVLASAFDLFDNGYKIKIMLDKCANMNGQAVDKVLIKQMFEKGK